MGLAEEKLDLLLQEVTAIRNGQLKLQTMVDALNVKLTSRSSPASSTTPPSTTPTTPTSIDATTLVSTATMEPLQAPPARCSTPGRSHGERALVPVTAAPAPSSTSSLASCASLAASDASAAAPATSLPATTAMPTPMLALDVSDAEEEVTNETPISCSSDGLNRDIDSPSVLLLCPSFTGSLEVLWKKQSWPPPMPFQFMDNSSLLVCSTAHCVFDRGKNKMGKLTITVTMPVMHFGLAASGLDELPLSWPLVPTLQITYDGELRSSPCPSFTRHTAERVKCRQYGLHLQQLRIPWPPPEQLDFMDIPSVLVCSTDSCAFNCGTSRPGEFPMLVILSLVHFDSPAIGIDELSLPWPSTPTVKISCKGAGIRPTPWSFCTCHITVNCNRSGVHLQNSRAPLPPTDLLYLIANGPFQVTFMQLESMMNFFCVDYGGENCRQCHELLDIEGQINGIIRKESVSFLQSHISAGYVLLQKMALSQLWKHRCSILKLLLLGGIHTINMAVLIISEQLSIYSDHPKFYSASSIIGDLSHILVLKWSIYRVFTDYGIIHSQSTIPCKVLLLQISFSWDQWPPFSWYLFIGINDREDNSNGGSVAATVSSCKCMFAAAGISLEAVMSPGCYSWEDHSNGTDDVVQFSGAKIDLNAAKISGQEDVIQYWQFLVQLQTDGLLTAIIAGTQLILWDPGGDQFFSGRIQ